MHTLLHFLGLRGANSTPYLFWSGIGSDIGEFAIAGAIVRGAFKITRNHDINHHKLHKHMDYEFTKLNDKIDG